MIRYAVAYLQVQRKKNHIWDELCHKLCHELSIHNSHRKALSLVEIAAHHPKERTSLLQVHI